MKVKLLKKVRKRFSITKVEEINRHSSSWYKENVKKQGLPFYHVRDKYSQFTFYGHKKYIF